MQTIFVSSFHPLISRNLLSTYFLSKLSENFRVVILVPGFKQDYFKKTFGKYALIEPIRTEFTSRDLFFRKLFLAFSSTRNLYIKKRAEYYADKKLFSFLSSALPAMIFRGSRPAVSFIRLLDRLLPAAEKFFAVFEKYQPKAVFSTDLQNELDVSLLREARTRNLVIAGMVRSWDNLSSKGLLRILPERLFVHNNIIKSEAVRWNFMPEEKISVVGIPHYDRYLEAKNIESKEKFFSRFKLDPSRKLIVYAPIGDRYVRDNRLDGLVLSTLAKLPVNILVRLPPTDQVTLPRFENLTANIVFDQPGVGFSKGSKKLQELSLADDSILIATIHHADLVVTGHSTIAIDAAIIGRPIISIYFDSEPRVYWDSFLRYYHGEYYQPIIESGGVRLATSPSELLELAELYLRDPALDKSGRAVIVSEQVGYPEGGAGKRLAEALANFIGK